MNGLLIEQYKFVQALAPAADRWGATAGTNSDVINLARYGGIAFVVEQGGSTSTAGTVTFTVQRCTSSAGAGASAMPFHYSVRTASDTWSAVAAATSAGYANPSSSLPQSVVIEVDSQALLQGTTTEYDWVRLRAVEGSATARNAGVTAILRNARFKAATLPTAI